MEMFNIDEIKYRVAQKYGLPESSIDESVISVYVLMEKMHLDLEKQVKNIEMHVNKKQRNVYYDNPKTAFWGNFGGIGIIGICAMLSIVALSLWYNNQNMVQNIKALEKVVQVEKDGYYVRIENTKKVGNKLKIITE